MTTKAIYFDSSLCSGCKGCQAACKNWNLLPSPMGLNANATVFTHSYQNPPDLNNMTRLIMTFKEEVGGPKGVKFAFGRRSCQHCEKAPCAVICPSGAIYKDEETGLVPIDPQKCIGCQYCSAACPFDVPRYYAAGPGSAFLRTPINKCHGCIDRVRHGLKPACVKTCQPGALQFGDRDEMVAKAKERVEILKQRGFEDAVVYGIDEDYPLNVIHVLKYGVEAHEQLPDPEFPGIVTAVEVMKPVVGIGSGVTVLGLGAMAALAAGYKRSKLAYNAETGDTINADTGEVVKHGDGQDTESVMEHITEGLPVGKHHEEREERKEAHELKREEHREASKEKREERKEAHELKREEHKEERAEKREEHEEAREAKRESRHHDSRGGGFDE